jgi:hypothetical protein
MCVIAGGPTQSPFVDVGGIASAPTADDHGRNPECREELRRKIDPARIFTSPQAT